MKRLYDQNKQCLIAIDGEYEFELTGCYSFIRQWKKQFFRKNSKYPSSIKIRCNYAAPDVSLWKYWIEINVNGKIFDQQRICDEAYNILKENFEGESYGGTIEIITLETFEPGLKN